MAYPTDQPLNAKWFGAYGDGTHDDTTALQNAINAASYSTQSGQALYIPGGTYKITSALSLPRQYIDIKGDGPWNTIISFNGVAGGGIVAAAQASLRPCFEGFQLSGNSGSGHGIDLSAVSGDVYLGYMRDMVIQGCGGKAIYVYNNVFSFSFINVAAGSVSDHAFCLNCGPSVSLVNCYALTTGANKAGYRLSGSGVLVGCNGLNSGDYWGVFGNDTTDTGGAGHFGGDFAGNSYPDFTLLDCNVEAWAGITTNGTVDAIQLNNGIRHFEFIGGKFDKTPNTAYNSVVRQRKQSNGYGLPVRLSPGFFTVTGTQTAGSLAGDAVVFWDDPTKNLAINGVTTWVYTPGPTTYSVNALTVANLPSASTMGKGARYVVTDANATTYNSVVAGGGSNTVGVVSDGTNWRIG